MDIDSVQTTLRHRELIRTKRFLREIYRETYQFYLDNLPEGEGGVLELGSGGGFIKEFIPTAYTSDVVPLPEVDVVCTAERLPFPSASLRAIVMMNVFHHIQEVSKFLTEAVRVLIPGGRIIMVEPAHTWLSRIVYSNFHHEPFDPSQVAWELPPGGRLSRANDALPWIVFWRDRAEFVSRFPALSIHMADEFMPFRYILSGGLSLPQLLPSWAYPLVVGIERILYPLRGMLGLMAKIVVERKGA